MLLNRYLKLALATAVTAVTVGGSCAGSNCLSGNWENRNAVAWPSWFSH